MGNVVKFEAHGKAYPLSVKEENGEKWVSLQQVGEALGNHSPRRTMSDLKQNGEFKEGKHYRSVTERQPGDTQARTRVELSYRGITRFAMRSQGSRAREFRDWAEDVLYQVMMTGSYEIDRSFPEALSQAESAGMKRAFIIKEIAERHNLSMETIGMIIKFRKMGLTQTQVGAAYGLSKYQIQRLETDLKEAGIVIQAVRKKTLSASIDDLVDTLTSSIEMPLLTEGGANGE